MGLQLDTGEQGQPIQQICRYLSERSPQPMIAVEGPPHIIIYLNPAFAQMVGKTKNELVGRPFAEAVPEGEGNGCLALLDRVYRTGNPENLAEQDHYHTQPRPVYWSYSVWAILGENDRPAGVMIQVTDSTEAAIFRRQAMAMNEALLVSAAAQHQLTEAAELLNERLKSAVQARDHFLALLSHELRNPLAALSNGLQLLKVAGIDPIRVDSPLAMMDRQLKQMVRLVDDLLDVSRIATGKLKLRKERVDLATVVRDAVDASRPLIESGGHTLWVMPPAEPIVLDADPTRLAQVFLNLLNNAAKYSDRGGQIRLSVDREGDEVVVSVRDTGIGIIPPKLPHIFDVFVQVDTAWQRAQGGLGIGLSLVKEFVTLHGGRVEARSDGLGKGSEFIVHLPALAETTIAAPPAIVPETSDGPRRRILVVDDNRDAAESLAKFLRIMGHDVRTAHDGEAGVDVVEGFRPEVILLDIGMPLVDGYETARRIRAELRGHEPFLVALTGWGSDDDRRRTNDAGFDRHLVKPVDPDDLIAIMAEIPTQCPLI